jgi:hypothetical protein
MVMRERDKPARLEAFPENAWNLFPIRKDLKNAPQNSPESAAQTFSINRF